MEARTGRRPTLDEVALRAGVSRSVASRAINNTRDVSRAAREAVDKAVRELGYVPNPTARALATSQAGTVLLAVSHDEPGLFADPFFARVIVGINAALEKTDLVLMLLLADSERGRERLERVLRSRRADGIMLLALHGEDPLHHLAQRLDLPVVLGGRPLHGEPSWYVDADNRGGARLATEHLIASGRRRIAAITGRQDTRAGVERHRGHREAMAVAGLDSSRTEAADFTEAGGAEAMRRLLERFGDLDAVFAQSDNMAAGAVRTLKAAGRSVPGDVAVAGFDDLPVALTTEPALTTVHQPVQALGQEMAKMLIALMAGEQPTPLLLPTHLVVRASAP
ncbi:LacI family DNA-binding transcriptional regulator [Streptomyces sp. SL13]|uniref:LacI family DNA-binding transcriptional regulator n=1 Tax=Streptantibioticus silvisoli TaxID=2705255 RepID=A0AA90H875_9ACTN|nr:LacI family DNA-binding transcriptional regulator [Streptantibioticus silvisoli]MDI5963797.1 LacI family DNA-binding transcriptional regulator [Streptantibioticus silvisoli]MDI5972820.1 LacI family DNA-binding transcriptional regulator [Streptantibioticus silvisoli]